MQTSRAISILLVVITCSHFATLTSANAELRALMEIKSSLDPENKHLSSWTSDGDPCGGSFLGVACNEHRKVANISLQGKELAGKVPPAVAELKCLSGLYLHYNSLSGEIPKEIAGLTELTDLYLNVNNLTGGIPKEIGNMTSIQVLQLCCNQLTGTIPAELGLLKKLSFLALERNRLTGQISSSLGNLIMLKRLYLSFNNLSGPIPVALTNIPSLEIFDVQNNTLSGVVPSGLKKLNEGFHFENNPGLCGTGFSSLRACTSWDIQNLNRIDPSDTTITNQTGPDNLPKSANFPVPCNNQTQCSKPSSKLPKIGIVAGVIILPIALTIIVFICIIRYRRGKQKVGNKSDTIEDRLSCNESKDSFKRSPSPLSALEYSNTWYATNAGQECDMVCHHEFSNIGNRFNLEEVESATQHFSEANLLGKSTFSAVYKGILKDGSVVAIKSINKTSCKIEEDEFMRGMSLLNSLKHENLVRLRGFCCSKARGECFLIYDFVPKGTLSKYLDVDEDGSSRSSYVLDWHTRVNIINGIAKGILYLHSSEPNKPPIIHQNISVKKFLLDRNLKPLVLDSGLLKLLADDVVYSALKVSAALGYMAPEYISTGRFTEKSDVYAYGVIILQVLSGKTKLSSTIRTAAESGKVEEFIDSKLDGKFSEDEALRLTKIALDCTNDNPENRPSIEAVVTELNEPSSG